MSDWTPRVADTSWLYALYDETDQHHDDAARQLAKPAPIVLAGEVATEAIGLWRHRLGRRASRICFDDIRGRPNVELIHDTEADEAAALMDEVGGSFVDAVVLWHCRRLGTPALSYDRRLFELAPSGSALAPQRHGKSGQAGDHEQHRHTGRFGLLQ